MEDLEEKKGKKYEMIVTIKFDTFEFVCLYCHDIL